MKQNVLKIQKDNRVSDVEICPPVSLKQILIKEKIPFRFPCGGNAHCGKCKVKIVGEMNEITKEEYELLSDYEINQNVRLACFTEIQGNATVWLESSNVMVESSDKLSSIVADGKDGYGIGFDVGTTTVVGQLFSLSTGEILKTITEENPQNQYGADVISRLQYGCSKSTELKKCIEDCLLTMYQRFSACVSEKISSIVIVGNTAMMTLLIGKSSEKLLFPPFQPEEYFGKEKTSMEWGLGFPSDTKVYIAPCISGYVGGDAVGSILTTDIFQKDEVSLLVDIGTNGEILLVKNGVIYACSTAAGPALEGVGISCGSLAVDGAVFQVKAMGRDLHYGVMGDKKVAGICGSGIIDLISILYKLKVVDSEGVLQKNSSMFCDSVLEQNNQMVFHLPTTDLYISQQDIQNVLLAKAAISSAISILCEHANCTVGEIDTCILSGGFGSNLSIQSACSIGLIPKELEKKTKIAGNTALRGAKQLLLQKQSRYDIIKISEKIKVLMLNDDPSYASRFIEKISL